MMKIYSFMFAISIALMSCGTSKSLQQTQGAVHGKQSNDTISTQQAGLDYIRRVNDNAIYAKNIVSDMDFTVSAMGHDIGLDGKLRMRRDECIRIDISYTMLISINVARLEFTPDYVLIMDHYHKHYVKSTYNDVDFLKNNGLDFYTLQSLFWNELFQPGKKSLGDSDLRTLTTDMTVKENRPITLNTGKFTFSWMTDVPRALITRTTVNYGKGTANASTMSFEYGDFVPVGSKKFPSKEVFTFNSKAVSQGPMSLTLKLNGITNDTNWNPVTTVSSSYTQVTAEELLRSIVNFQL